MLGTAAVLGLTTSSTLVGAVATKTILSGIATGVAGLDKAYNEKELLSFFLRFKLSNDRVFEKLLRRLF